MDHDELSALLGVSASTIAASIETAKRSLIPETQHFSIVERGKASVLKVTREGVGPLDTVYGTFNHYSFRIDDKWEKYSALVMAELSPEFIPVFGDPTRLLLRTDSGCETGQLFGDRSCECRGQLELALESVSAVGEGLVIHIPRQDGRGLGLPFKLATLRLQTELGVTTVQAPALLDPDRDRDIRSYAGIVAILKFLGVPATARLTLASNNPKKFNVFVENGWQSPTPQPVIVPATAFTRHHLLAKQQELGHVNLIQASPNQMVAVAGSLDTSLAPLARLQATILAKQTAVCCGLDPDTRRIPLEKQRATATATLLGFLEDVVCLTIDHVCAYKIQKAFFDLYPTGHHVLQEIITFIRQLDPRVFIILDCKIGDIDTTMSAYYQAFFDTLGVDAVVLNPYMGRAVWAPLQERPDKVGVILVHTSNPESAAVQDVILADGRPLWRQILDSVIDDFNICPNLMPVFATTVGPNLSDIINTVPPSMMLFVAGVGAQGGTPPVELLTDSRRPRFIVNSARAILYPYDPADSRWRDAILDAVISLKAAVNRAQ